MAHHSGERGKSLETPTDKTDSLDFWRGVLGYGLQEEIDFVEVPGVDRPLPDDILSCWPGNTEYEFEIWSRERAHFLKWLDLAETVEKDLPQAHLWENGPPEDKALLSLEFELRHSLPERRYILKRLHALGILGGQADLERRRRSGCRGHIARGAQSTGLSFSMTTDPEKNPDDEKASLT